MVGGLVSWGHDKCTGTPKFLDGKEPVFSDIDSVSLNIALLLSTTLHVEMAVRIEQIT